MHKQINLRQMILWFLSYVIIFGIAFIFGVVLYIRSANTIEQEIVQSNLSVLDQVKNGVDKKFQDINNILFELKWDNDIQSLSYYQQPFTNIQVYNISAIIQKLKLYTTANSAIKQLGIYYPKMQSVVANNSKCDADLYYNSELRSFWGQQQSWQKEIESKTGSYIKSGASQNLKDGFQTSLLWVEPLSIYGDSPNKVMITLNPSAFYEIIAPEPLSQNASLYIMNADGQILYSNTTEQLTERVKVIDSGAKNVVLADGKSYIINRVSSAVNGWGYYLLMPKDEYMYKLYEVKIFAVTTAIIIGIICMILAVVLTCLQYRPVRRILNTIVIGSGESSDLKLTDFGFIQHQLHRIQSDNLAMKEQIQTQTQLQGKIYLSNFITHKSLDLPILDMLEQCSIKMEYSHFTVVGFFFSADYVLIPSYDVEQELPDMAEAFIRRKKSDVNAFFFYIDHSLCGCINYGSDAIGDINNIIEGLYRELSDGDEINLLAAVSERAEDFYAMPELYSETLQIYRTSMQTVNGIVHYSQMMDGKTIPLVLLNSDFADSAANSMMAADAKHLLQMIEEKVNRITEFPPQYHKHLQIQLQSAFLHAIIGISERYKLDLSEFSSKIVELENCTDIITFVHALKQICMQLCSFIQGTPLYFTSGIEMRAIQIVQEKYGDPELSVFQIAQSLNVNAAYLSRAFKERSNEVLSSYISRYRTEMAKAYLAKGESVNETSRLCGFMNANTFIRVFKKYCGVTPGKYKELNQ